MAFGDVFAGDLKLCSCNQPEVALLSQKIEELEKKMDFVMESVVRSTIQTGYSKITKTTLKDEYEDLTK